jgi:hypothetical protein
MNRYATALVGGLMGLATGLMFVHPLSAFLGTTTVTWDASNCPAGTYTVTALARATANTSQYSVTTTNVSLPKASVAQTFQNLPPGPYTVSAVATPLSGTTFGSELVSLTSTGNDGGVITFSRSKPAGRPTLGVARSRNQPAEPTPPPTDRRLAPSAVPTNTSSPASPRAVGVLDPQLRQLFALLADDTGGADRQWRRVDAIDEDADGLVDYVAVESISGEIWIYRFHGS